MHLTSSFLSLSTHLRPLSSCRVTASFAKTGEQALRAGITYILHNWTAQRVSILVYVVLYKVKIILHTCTMYREYKPYIFLYKSLLCFWRWKFIKIKVIFASQRERFLWLLKALNAYLNSPMNILLYFTFLLYLNISLKHFFSRVNGSN